MVRKACVEYTTREACKSGGIDSSSNRKTCIFTPNFSSQSDGTCSEMSNCESAS